MRCLWLVVLVGAGCLPTVEVTPPPRCDVADGGISTPSGRAVLVGEPTTVVLSRRSASCPPSLDVTLQATVTDASSLPVVQTLAGPFVRGNFVTAEVTFTPLTPGLHRVEATFDPALGRAVNEVLAVGRARFGERVASIDGAVECLTDDATSRGAWVCLEQRSGVSQVSFWRGSAQLQAIPAVAFDVVDDTVWVFGRGEVERFVDRGGDVLAREPDRVLRLDADLVPSDELVVVDADSFFVVREGAIHLLTLGPSGLERAAPSSIPRGLCGGGARVRPSASGEVSVTCGSRPDWTRRCTFPLSTPSAARCREVEGRLVGSSAEASWLWQGQTLVMVDAEAQRSVTLPAGWSVASGRRLAGEFAPLVVDSLGRVFLLQTRGAALELEAMPDGLELLSFSRTHALLQGSSTRLLLAK
ncbi:MAG: hypothetical protein Q8S33_17620 [Myxococcales bacterium]|nr:hypothetical protein [Myxococcales bacterium]